MKIPTKKLKCGFEMPVYGLGTWQMGGRFRRSFKNNDQADIRAIKAALDRGIMHIDTAELYAHGHAEELVAKAIKKYNRKNIFLVSKVRRENLHYQDVLDACEKSLARLKTNYLDLYLIHHVNPSIDLEETMKALTQLKDKGLIKNIGVSNFTKETLAQAQKYTKHKIACNQVHYNLIIREPETTNLLDYCQNNDIMLVAYRPTQKGLLAKNGITPILDEMCQKYHKSPAQISINWLVSQTNVVTIAKTSNLGHLEENLGAINLVMERNDLEKLRKDFPNQQEVSTIGPLA